MTEYNQNMSTIIGLIFSVGIFLTGAAKFIEAISPAIKRLWENQTNANTQSPPSQEKQLDLKKPWFLYFALLLFILLSIYGASGFSAHNDIAWRVFLIVISVTFINWALVGIILIESMIIISKRKIMRTDSSS